MKLLLAKRLRQYRLEKDMTQEALAKAVGISPQSVSKWERGDGYPDITLLPGIANYFGLTIDELLGNDEISAREDVQKNYFNVHNKLSPEENLELSLKYHRKYPRNWHIATSLMHEITRDHRDKLDEYRPLLNEIAERILRECTDSVMRRSAIRAMCMVCEEEEIGEWLNRDSKFWHAERMDVYEQRYELMGDEEQYWMYRYAGNFLRGGNTIHRLQKHKSYFGKPKESLAWQKNYLRILDGMCGRGTDAEIPDGWIGEYGYLYDRFAAAYFGLGERENGYEFLRRSLALAERWADIPDKEPMSLGNPFVFGETKLIKNDWHILLPNGKFWPNFSGIRSNMFDLADIMTRETGWEWFDPIRNEPRYQQILAHARELTK